jgi:hypothetical protein
VVVFLLDDTSLKLGFVCESPIQLTWLDDGQSDYVEVAFRDYCKNLEDGSIAFELRDCVGAVFMELFIAEQFAQTGKYDDDSAYERTADLLESLSRDGFGVDRVITTRNEPGK